jgi:hypothetical protein
VVGEALARGCYQVMALTAPYLVGDAQALFGRLGAAYRSASTPTPRQGDH